MERRGMLGVIVLPFVTFGIYLLYWFVKTKGELNSKGAEIPTAWLIIVPFVNIYWAWKYFEGAEKVTDGKISGVLMFVLSIVVTSYVSMIICQDTYNKMAEENPAAPVA